MKKLNKKDKKFIKKLEAYNVEAKGRVKYALDRFDILIISLSSGGLALSLGIYEKFPLIEKSLINFGWLFFSSALISNLLSQITGYKANKIDIECTKTLIDEVKGTQPENEHIKLDCLKKIFNYLTSGLNTLSFICLTTAIILLIIFANTKIS